MSLFFKQLLMMGGMMMLQKCEIGQQQRGGLFGLLCRVVSPVFVNQTQIPINLPSHHAFCYKEESYGMQSGRLTM